MREYQVVAILVLMSCFMVAFEDPTTRKESANKTSLQLFNVCMLGAFIIEVRENSCPCTCMGLTKVCCHRP